MRRTSPKKQIALPIRQLGPGPRGRVPVGGKVKRVRAFLGEDDAMSEQREVVVTGGGTGIGLAIAARFAAAGERGPVTGRRKDVLEAAAERIGARAVSFDASDPAAVQAALAELPARVTSWSTTPGATPIASGRRPRTWPGWRTRGARTSMRTSSPLFS